jgi:hypothetical protein
MTVTFDWQYNSADPALDEFGYSVNDVFVALSSDVSGETGSTEPIVVLAGQTFCLIQNSTNSAGGNTNVNNWHVVYDCCKFHGITEANLDLPFKANYCGSEASPWADADPVTLNEAINRLAAAVSGMLYGPIPSCPPPV